MVITGGTVVTPEETLETSIAVDNGKIAAIGDQEHLPDGNKQIDASDRLILPGVVDPHVHIDGYLSIDSYESGTKAAAVGGVTSCVNFAWQAWTGELSIWDTPGTLTEAVQRQRQKGTQSLIDYALHGTITREDPAVLKELPSLIEDGITSFKLFTAYELKLSSGFLDRILEEIASLDAVAVFHTEDASVCESRTARLKTEGRSNPEHYPEARPDYAEAMAADNALRLAEKNGTKYYGVHTSSQVAAETIKQYQTDSSQVRAETCTHYTALDKTQYERQGSLPIMAPPLRSSTDQETLFEYLQNGPLSVVSTDHVAFKRDSKEVEKWWDSSFGVNSLQTSLPIFHDEAVNKRGYSYPFLVRVLCRNPARAFGLKNKGTLEPGTDADIVIFDPTEAYTINASENQSKADYSIYEGREVTGRVKKTFLRGKLIADDGEITAASGYGQYINRDIPDWEEMS